MILFYGVSSMLSFYYKMVVIRAGFEVYSRNIILFCSTYMTSIAVPVPLVLIPKYTAGCKASDSYS